MPPTRPETTSLPLPYPLSPFFPLPAHLVLPFPPHSAMQFRRQMKCSSVHGILIFAANLTILRAPFLPLPLFPTLPVSFTPLLSSVRHVVRLQINLMSVILPLSGKFLKFHQKSVAYPNPYRGWGYHMLLGGIGCTEVLLLAERI